MRPAELQDDLQAALRRVKRASGASVLIVGLIALAIAMSGCVFAVAYGLLWKPLPFHDQGELVQLTAHSGKMGIDLGWSVPYLDRIARNGKQLAGVGGYRRKETARTDESGRYIGAVQTVSVEPQALALLGAHVMEGRLFAPGDTRRGAEPVALVSESMRRQQGYGRVGSNAKLHLAGRTYRIVGVLPDDFAFPDRNVQVWLPLGFTPEQTAVENAGSFGNLRVIARLRPGASATLVDAEISGLVASEPTLKWIADQIDLRLQARPLRALWIDGRENSLKSMLAAVVLTFAVTLANAYNLFLLALLKRRQELALLEAVGATSRRRAMQIALQAGILSVVASVLALAITPLGIALLRRFEVLPDGVPQFVGLDGATVFAVVAMCLLAATVLASTCLFFQRQNAFEVLRQSGNGQTGSTRVQLLRRGLVMAQLGATLILLFSTVLLIRSSDRLLAQDIGFERSGRIIGTLRPALEGGDVDVARTRSQMAAWVTAVSSEQGIASIGLSSSAPFSENVTLEALSGTPSRIPEGDDSRKAYVAHVSAAFPNAAGMHLRQGRAFTSSETEAGTAVALVSADLVAQYFAGSDPIGRSIGVSGGENGRTAAYTVVGVVDEVRQRSLSSPDEYPSVYLPSAVPYRLPGVPLDSVEFVVEASNPGVAAGQLTRLLRSNAPGLRITGMVTMEQRIDDTIVDLLRLNVMLKILSVVTLLLTAVGLYALLSHSVAMRTREFGVRQALGATASDLLKSVLAQGLRLVARSMLCAAPIALLVGSLLKSRLHDAPVVDVGSLVFVAGGLVVVGLVANAIPAYRASRVNPMEALRSE